MVLKNYQNTLKHIEFVRPIILKLNKTSKIWKMKRNGKLIVIEGTDYSGKETQTKKLIERLNKEKVSERRSHYFSFPKYNTPTGKIVGECYLGKDLGYGGGSWFSDPVTLDPKIASLYYAADRRATLPEMKRILESGENIISDRYVTSNMGHQGGKIANRDERKDFLRYLHKLEYELLELPEPDKVIFLYMPYQVSMELKKSRVEKSDAHESNPNHLRQAEEAYLELAEEYNWTKINCAPNKTKDSLRSIEDIHKEVFNIVKKELKNKKFF